MVGLPGANRSAVKLGAGHSLRRQARFHAAAAMYARNASSTSPEARTSALSATRKNADVIVSYIDRQSGVKERQFRRVDATEEVPFLVTRMSPYCDHD